MIFVIFLGLMLLITFDWNTRTRLQVLEGHSFEVLIPASITL